MTDELAVQPASDAAPVIDAPAAPSPAPEPKESSAIEKMQKRIDQLTYRLRETERQQARPESPPPAPEPLKPPSRADESINYDDDKYQAALIAYTEQVAERKAQELLDKREREHEETTRKKTFKERIDAFAKSKPDFHEKVARESLPFDGPLLEAIQTSDLGPEVAYYLAENEDKAHAIAQLSPFLIAKEIGRIEAQLEAAKAPPPAPIKQSAAPPPVPKIQATDDEVSEKDPSRMTDAEFAKWRRKQIAQRR